MKINKNQVKLREITKFEFLINYIRKLINTNFWDQKTQIEGKSGYTDFQEGPKDHF